MACRFGIRLRGTNPVPSSRVYQYVDAVVTKLFKKQVRPTLWEAT